MVIKRPRSYKCESGSRAEVEYISKCGTFAFGHIDRLYVLWYARTGNLHLHPENHVLTHEEGDLLKIVAKWELEIEDDLVFIECDSCRAKPGSPVLCNSCLYNRSVIEKLRNNR